MWVRLKLKLTPNGDFTKTGILAFFVKFLMHSPKCPGGGGVLPNMGYIGMYGPKG